MARKAGKMKATQGDLKKAWLEALYIHHDGRVGPSVLLEASRDPSSPFHDDFEWDDEEAGEQWRLAQAASIIRRWTGKIVKPDREKKTVTVTTERRVQSPGSLRGEGRLSYKTTEDIMSDPILREDMLQTVLRELMSYRKRYAALKELAEVWYAIDQVADSARTHEISATGDEARI